MSEENPSAREVLELLAERLKPDEDGTLSPEQQQLAQGVLKLMGEALGVSGSKSQEEKTQHD